MLIQYYKIGKFFDRPDNSWHLEQNLETSITFFF